MHPVESTDVGLPMPNGFNSYALACGCGNDTWRVLGKWFDNATEFVGPLFAECVQCGARRRIINTATDGFNGEIGDGIVEADTPRDLWVCSKCGSSDGPLVASFGYHFEPDAEISQRQHDYFDVFILTHICGVASHAVQVAMFDCA